MADEKGQRKCGEFLHQGDGSCCRVMESEGRVKPSQSIETSELQDGSIRVLPLAGSSGQEANKGDRYRGRNLHAGA